MCPSRDTQSQKENTVREIQPLDLERAARVKELLDEEARVATEMDKAKATLDKAYGQFLEGAITIGELQRHVLFLASWTCEFVNTDQEIEFARNSML
jgi:hypothetical protein